MLRGVRAQYSGTAIFLRKLLERCGIELIPADNPRPPPEMEALMEYFCSDNTKLTHTDYRDRLYHEISKRKKEARRREQQRQRESEEGGELVADGGDGGDALPAEGPPGEA